MIVPETEIIVSKDGAEILRMTVRPGEYVIGREVGCDVPVEVDLVSRRHAQLTVNYDHALIEDLGSSNGTFVNGKPVTESTRLWPNQKIQIGAATIELRRVKTLAPPDVSLAPSAATVQRLLPEELLRERRYDIGGVVAQGGMGAILDAQESAIQRGVAMKVMLDGSSPDDLVRFIAEARVTGQLEHPNIVPVHELGVDENGQVFYTMKFVKGITLRKVLELMAEGAPETLAKYPLATLLTVFQKVCDAVAFAHSKGVIHRDLKPENIMLGDFGEVLLMDWGLAKVLGERSTSNAQRSTSNEERIAALPIGTATMTGSIMGTPQYMAPEQARGEIEQLDARADIYALGAILYHLLALRPSVTGDDAYAIVEKVARGEMEPLVAKGRRSLTIPDSLAAVVRKAMALEKTQRYASVADLQADLTAFQTGFATKAEDAGLAKQLVLLVKRNKGIFATAAAAWLLITALAIWFVLNLRAKEQRALAGEQTALVQKEAARRSAAKASLSLAEASLREANGPAMQAALNDVPDDLRDTTWGYLLAQSDSSLARLRTGAEAIEGVAADPARPGVFAVAERNQKITVMNVRTGERLLEFQPGFATADKANRYRIAFSPDGQHIAVGRARNAVGRDGPGDLVIHRAKDGAKVKEWATPPTDRLEFGRNDALLRQGGGSLQVWNPITGQLWWEEKVDGNIGIKGTFIPGGSEVVTFTSKNRLRLVKANDGSLIRELGGRVSGYDWFMAVRPDGKAVVTWNETQVTECISLEDGRTLFALPEKKLRWHMGFSHDGAMLFTAALRVEGVQSIEVWNAETGEFLRALLGGRGQITGLGLHPASHELLVAGADSRVWDTTGPSARWRFRSLPAGNMAFWGPDDWAFGWVDHAAQWGLHRLGRDGVERLWQPQLKAAHVAETSADGKLAVLARPGWSREITLLRKSGTNVEQVHAFTANISPYRIRPSPKGSRMAFMERTRELGLQVYDTAGKVAVTLEAVDHQRISDLGWLDEHRLLGLLTLHAARGNPGSQESLVVWDADTGKLLQTATHPTAMDALAIAPDGRSFAEAGADKLVRIRDATTLAVQKQFRAHDAPITVLAWHPDKPIIATGSEDLSIKVWKLGTERLVTEYRDLLNPPVHLAFSPTGRLLGAKTFSDNLLRIWQIEDTPPLPARSTEPATTKAAPAKPATAMTAPLPGADGWEDLLAQLTPAEVARTGNGWRMEGGALYSSSNGFAALPLPGNFSNSSYRIRVQLRQLAPQCLHLVLPVADRMTGFDLDGVPQDGFYTGMVLVDGKHGASLPGSIKGRQIRDSEKHDLEVTVELEGTKAGIKVTLDNQPLYEWTGSAASLSQHGLWKTPASRPALGSFSADWVVSEVKVKRLKGK